MDYQEFLQRKITSEKIYGFEINEADIHPILKPHQKAIVKWMVRGGRRACFASFGLGKTLMQLEAVRLTREKAGGMGLIVAPLGVRWEFMNDAKKVGIDLKFIRKLDECDNSEGIYITNYETVRDGKLNPQAFSVASLDEAACLRGFGGTKTFREFMAVFAGDRKTLNDRVFSQGVNYRFVATATPSPNHYEEMLAYSAYLDIMDVSTAKTRFFKRNSTKADQLTIHPHKEQEFWEWVATWAMFVTKPSDLGFEDTGYILPELKTHWHMVKTDHSKPIIQRDKQMRMFHNPAIGIIEASREKKASLHFRIEQVRKIVRQVKGKDQIVIWCDLNQEQKDLEKMLKQEGVSFSSLYGNQKIDDREKLLDAWKAKETTVFLSKPQMYGAGVNLQQCHTMIFAGIGFKFADMFQGIHRIHRFLQEHPCDVHFVYSEAEKMVRKTLERKWQQHNRMVTKMIEIIREYDLSLSAMADRLQCSMGVDRVEIVGERYKIINNDSILETQDMEENSIGLVLTSIPFSTQYEYSPNYSDLGHTDNNAHFWEHMDFLTPELLRVLMPGRIAAIHVKDRVVPGGMTGLGFQTVYPFHVDAIQHFQKHGFGFMGMKTIVTDVVRENNQTYRLGWTEQCKDGTKMGVGMPEYLLLFRKPPTDTADAYADDPVIKTKQRYTRGKWQIDAHGFARSSGNRHFTPQEIMDLPHEQIFKLYRKHSLEHVYDFEHHVKVSEKLDAKGRLPVTFMLLQPQSWSPDVWTDITRMLTLNSSQSRKNKVMHLCPMQFDIADRVIEQMSMDGETVYDPFGGIMTVPYRAILAGRYGLGVELSNQYFLDGATYCKAAEKKVTMPSLDDLQKNIFEQIREVKECINA